MQSDGRIVVGGSIRTEAGSYDLALARYSTYGTLDPSFGTKGRVTTDIGVIDVAYDLDLQRDGKICSRGPPTDRC